MTAIQRLNFLELLESQQKHPTLPYHVSRKHSDKKANDLTRAVVRWIQLHGGQAERVSVTGRMIDNRKTFTDTVGRVRMVGSVKRIPASMQRGTADISATIAGKSVKIEVKIGRDRQSEAQKTYQMQVERAGGVYLIATSLQQFVDELEHRGLSLQER